MSNAGTSEFTGTEIAIIGMAGRFPGARNIEEYWVNLRAGKECIKRLGDDELRAAGVGPSDLNDPHYVKACGQLDDVAGFDAQFFGYSPKDAGILDPQHRHFHECVWEALEHAGYSARNYEGSIGLFAGCGMNSYFIWNILSNPELVRSVRLFLLRHTGNDRDFMPTSVSYKLNLRGPSVAVQTACSTSLVATHMACQSLLSGECDIAVAGGVTIIIPPGQGYHYAPNEVQSPDGHCRPFDAEGAGTVLTSGAGVVALRRLDNALADGDTVHAVIRGSAINNDGAGKVGYLAPSVDGHARAVAEALAVAGLEADDISYIEAHGTGTLVGDPIEIAALTAAFRKSTKRSGFCRIGSVKSNIGHLDTAAGVASLIKVVEALKRRELPATINFRTPNPAADWSNCPFVVNDRLTEWSTTKGPRRAGVSSLGVGGTNAHVVVEEAPAADPTDAPLPYEVLSLSARSAAALDRMSANLAEHLKANPGVNLGDVAYTLQVGREGFEYRRIVAAKDVADAGAALGSKDAKRVVSNRVKRAEPSVAFMFPGGGSQYPGMARELYDTHPVFRKELDACLEILRPLLPFDLRAMLLAPAGAEADLAARLAKPCASVCGVFCVEYALAKLWMSWGVQPAAMTGHSLGEYTAACLAGVMSLSDALKIVALRGALVERAPDAAMISVQMAEDQALARINGDLDLAVVNAPTLCVLAGTSDRLATLEQELKSEEIECRRLRLTGASHSRFVEPILDEFRSVLSGIRLSPPQISYVSNVTGTWVKPEDATSPAYWVRHFRETVRFSQGVSELLKDEGRVLLEVGPGQTLSSLARQQPVKPLGVVSSMRHPDDNAPDGRMLMTAVGALWAAGVPIDWAKIRGKQSRRRVPLPTYPWDHNTFWIEPGRAGPGVEAAGEEHLARIEKIDDWFAAPVWRERGPGPGAASDESCTLVFADRAGIGDEMVRRLRSAGKKVVLVREGDAFLKVREGEYAVAPEAGREGYDALIAELASSASLPTRIAHCWTITPDQSHRPGSSFFHSNMERGFYSLMFLAQALGSVEAAPKSHVVVFSTGMQAVEGKAEHPDKAILLGPVRVMPREFAGMTCASVDFATSDVLAPRSKKQADPRLATAERAIGELGRAANCIAAYRGARRFEQVLEPAPISAAAAPVLRPKGVCLITGGLGGMGLAIAQRLAKDSPGAKLVLVGRSPLPARGQWDEWLAAHPSKDRTSQRIRAVRAVEALGAEVMTAAGDVASPEAMRAVLDQARSRFGGIHAVVHAAGDVEDGVMLAKSQETCEKVFTPKVHGTLLLASLLKGQELDFFAMCSSTSALTGPAGQADYAGANAFLDAFAESASAPRAKRVAAINWGVWRGVGMAAPISRRLGGVGGKGEESGVEVIGRPLLHERVSSDGRETVFATMLTVNEQWILDEHRTRGRRALIPGTGYLEAAADAAQETLGAAWCEIRDVSFLSPLAVGDDETREMRVIVRKDSVGATFEIVSRPGDGGSDEAWSMHAQGSLRRLDGDAPASMDLDAVKAACGAPEHAAPGESLRTGQFEHVEFGPRWMCLRSVWMGKGQALAMLELSEQFRADLERHHLHPAVLDLATGFPMALIPGYKTGGSMYVPLSYHRVRVRGPLPARVYSRAVIDAKTEPGADVAVFDFQITDERGNVIVEVERFAMRRLTDEQAFAAAGGTTKAAGGSGGADTRAASLSPGERLFMETYAAGIDPDEGAEAFVRALSAGRPRVVASSVDVNVIARRMDSVSAQPSDSGVRFARPTLDSAYEAPRDQLERTLAAWWQDLLGVDQVGINDNFFDLGGHSLIAVRLFAKIKKTYEVEYPISALFEAPTVAACAEMLRRELGESAASAETGAPGDATAKPGAAPAKRRFVVPMRMVKDATKPPLFINAGMFGNVLNLRHISQHLGEDQPVYAIQARGLLGDEKPHTSFEEMATDYLQEIRSIQPHGPYFLAGFSGGGNTAFEMAQQLVRAGETIGLLVLLDSRPAEMPELKKSEKMLMHVHRLRKQGPSYLTQFIKRRIEWEKRKRERAQGAAPAAELTPAEFRSKEIERAFYASLAKYRTSIYPGDVHLFRPPLAIEYRFPGNRMANEGGLFLENFNFWRRFVGGEMHVHEVTGDHDSMMLEPHVRVLAAKFRKVLAQAQAAAAQGLPASDAGASAKARSPEPAGIS